MSLPVLVEYILAQEKSGGEPLTTLSGAAVYIQNFPASTTSNFILKPDDGEYAFFLYRALWDYANIPQAFSVHIQHRGVRTFDGTIHEVVSNFGLDGFLVVTEAEQFFSQVTNRTNVAQRISFGFNWLTARTREDASLVQEAIKRYGGR